MLLLYKITKAFVYRVIHTFNITCNIIDREALQVVLLSKDFIETLKVSSYYNNARNLIYVMLVFVRLTECTCYNSLVPTAYCLVSPGGHTEEAIVGDV